MQYRMILAAVLALGNSAYALPHPQVTQAPSPALAAKRQGSGSGGSTVLDAPMTIAAGESFDGGNAVFDRGVSCTGQAEGGDSDAVFILEAGATLSNVRIGPNQIEGVHCMGGCTVNNVYWEAVCEDAFTIKKQADGETTTINGGGATGAEDKVIQHNGGGTVVIKDFEVSDFGKLYRSCGNCKSMPARHVEISGGSASNGKVLVGINPNMGDTAKISGISITGVKEECVTYKGVTDGSEPEKVGTCDGSGSGSTDGETTASPTGDEASATSAAGDSDNSDDEATPVETAAPQETESGDDNQDDSQDDNSDNQDENNDNQDENNDSDNQDDSNQDENSGDDNNESDNQDDSSDNQDDSNDDSNQDNQDNQDDNSDDENQSESESESESDSNSEQSWWNPASWGQKN